MLSEAQLKQRIGLILTLEEHGDDADWFAIADLSIELVQLLPESAPEIVRAYLVDIDRRRCSRNFGNAQRTALVQYLRSSADGSWIAPDA